MALLFWLLALLNPYQFTVPQHTGATAGSSSAPTVAQVCAPSGGIPGSGSQTCTPLASVATGSLIVNSVGSAGSQSTWTNTQSSDSGSNSYTLGPNAYNSSDNYSVGQWWSYSTTGLTTASTMTYTATSYGSMAWVYISGLTGHLDTGVTGTNAASGTAATVSTGSNTAHTDICIAVFVLLSSNTIAAGSGWTQEWNTNSGQILVEWKSFAASQAVTATATLTTSASYLGAVSCYY